MRIEHIKEIANAVLYEGYLLYPYRQSAIKNRTRWTFGVVYPREYSEANGAIEPWTMHTECLLEGELQDISLAITVRFLHLLTRTVVQPEPVKVDDGEARADEWSLAGLFAGEPQQEGVEREVSILDLSLSELVARPRVVEMAFPGGRIVDDADALPGSSPPLTTRSVLEQQPLMGAVILAAEPVGEHLFKLSVHIENRTPDTGGVTNRRDAAVFQSFVSTHTILQVRQGAFISLLEPPEELQPFVRACQNRHTWPVLVGNQGERDALVSSPIILYDYPQIAPESPGPLFDGGEIDEILSLRILTLTDEEKEQMRQDERAREILERTEALTPAQFMKLHGAIRDLRPVSKGEKA
ncbi:MAG: hypothetical protein ABI456_22180 [Ktedonobacteraceae bacterium]